MSYPFADATSAHFEVVGRVEDWADGQAREIKVHKKPMTVARLGDEFFAVNSVCPHMGGPLSCGKVVDGSVQCPWHEWRFNLATGKSPNGHAIERYEVHVENGEVKIGWVKSV